MKIMTKNKNIIDPKENFERTKQKSHQRQYKIEPVEQQTLRKEKKKLSKAKRFKNAGQR